MCDNLNTHKHDASLVASKSITHQNMARGSIAAEIELAALTRQCLARRICDLPTLQSEINAWNTQPNADQTNVNWQFTTADARIQLKRLYPVIDD